MALIVVPGGLFVPPIPRHIEDVAALTTLNSINDGYAFLCRVPKQGTLDKFEVRTHATSVLAAGSSVKFSFQDVTTALDPAQPGGIVDQFRDVPGSSIPAGSWISPGLMTSDGTDGGTKRDVNRNELLACVVAFQTFTAGDSLVLARPEHRGGDLETDPAFAHFPSALVRQNFGGFPWIQTTTRQPAILALKYSDGTYGFVSPEMPPILSAVPLTFNVGSGFPEAGAEFLFPFPVRVSGAWIMTDHDAAAGDYEVRLYAPDGVTPLAQVAVSTGQVAAVSSRREILYVPFPAEYDLAANVYHRLAIRASEVTDTRLHAYSVQDSTLLQATPGGIEWHQTKRADSGSGAAWVQDLTRVPLLGLHVTAVEEDESGGGGGGGGGFVMIDRGFSRGLVG